MTTRRKLLRAAALSLGGLASLPGLSQVMFPKESGDNPMASPFGAGGSAVGTVSRAEAELYDCEVDGQIPRDLDGAFYRVGPDPQYPKAPGYENDIFFDGEGHVSMFRIKDGHVDYRSRYARTERWLAQHAARRSLYGLYRSPLTDDPSVRGLSRGTANTQLFVHHGRLLVLKEDSPPVALDPHTLETLDNYYTYGGTLKSLTHTAHPKIDPVTGHLVGFGYQATGVASNDVNVFSIDLQGKMVWEAWIKVPYSSLIHDFAVTQRHIIFYVIPLMTNMDQIRTRQLHYTWDSTMPCYLGVFRRGGDGKDIRWFTGSQLFCDHTMGAWSDGDKVYLDMDGQEGNRYFFFPTLHGPDRRSPGQIRRFTVDLRSRASTYHVETLCPEATGGLSRQDDRYHTVPYRFGFLNGMGPSGSKWQVIDQLKSELNTFSLPDYALSEMCFVPRRMGAPEGDGYLIGIGNSLQEHRRSDLLLVDTQDLSAPIARVKMPFQVAPQIHGFWAPAEQLPPASVSVAPTQFATAGDVNVHGQENFPSSWTRPAYNRQTGGDVIGSFGAGALSHRAWT